MRPACWGHRGSSTVTTRYGPPAARRVAISRAQEMLATPMSPWRYDAAVVAASTEHHRALALPIILAGLPLLIEKPVCPSLAQTREVVDASRAAGTPLQCGLLERFNPAVVTALRMVEAPCYVRAERHSPYASRIRTGVGWDLLVHDVDLVVRAFGGQARVSRGEIAPLPRARQFRSTKPALFAANVERNLAWRRRGPATGVPRRRSGHAALAARFDAAPADFRFATAVMGAAEIFRHSPHAKDWSYALVQEIAQSTAGNAERDEFVKLLGAARKVAVAAR